MFNSKQSKAQGVQIQMQIQLIPKPHSPVLSQSVLIIPKVLSFHSTKAGCYTKYQKCHQSCLLEWSGAVSCMDSSLTYSAQKPPCAFLFKHVYLQKDKQALLLSSAMPLFQVIKQHSFKIKRNIYLLIYLFIERETQREHLCTCS